VQRVPCRFCIACRIDPYHDRGDRGAFRDNDRRHDRDERRDARRERKRDRYKKTNDP
jgi:hypothetical protein